MATIVVTYSDTAIAVDCNGTPVVFGGPGESSPTPPRLADAECLGARSVRGTFSVAMAETGLGSFVVARPDGSGSIAISGSAHVPGSAVVNLTLASDLVPGVEYRLTADASCRDLAGTAIASDGRTADFAGPPPTINLLSVVHDGPQALLLTFDRAPAGTVRDPASYLVTSLGHVPTILSADHAEDPAHEFSHVVRLLLDSQCTGGADYSVEVAGIIGPCDEALGAATAAWVGSAVRPDVASTAGHGAAMTVIFTAPIDPATIGAAGDWLVVPLGAGDPVVATGISIAGSTVALVLDAALTPLESYRVTAPAAVADLSGNLVDDRTADFSDPIAPPAPLAAFAAEAIGPNLIQVDFDAPIDPATVFLADQWTLAPATIGSRAVAVAGVTLISDTRILIDVIPAMAPRTPYRLTALEAAGLGGGSLVPDWVEFTTGIFDDEAIGTPPSESFQGILVGTDVAPERIYPMLQKGLRQLDQEQGAALVERFLLRPEELWAAIQQKIARLPYLLDPASCPTEVLDHLRAHVAFGAGSGRPDEIASRLTAQDLRRLIMVAARYWKTRGQRIALSDAIRIFASGVRPAIDDWFFVRWLVDEIILGVEGGPGTDPWLIYSDIAEVPVGVSDGGQFETSIRVPDLGSVDRTLVQDLCDLARLPSERIEIAFVDFLDTFVDGMTGQWTSTPAGGQEAAWRAGSGATSPAILPGLVFPLGSAMRATAPRSAAWTNVVWSALLDWTGSHRTELRFFWQDVNNFYFADFVSATGIVRIGKTVGGATTILATGTADLTTPARRGVRVEALVGPGSAGNTIRVHVDGDLVVEHVGDAAFTQGTIEVLLDAASDDGSLALCRTEIFQVPLGIVSLGPA